MSLARSNPGYFKEGGKVIKCMQSLGTALMQDGLEQSKQFIGYSATERFGTSMPVELAHLPRQVDNSLRSYGSDTYSMGKELVWLSQVLPPAVQGNYTPYKMTGTNIRKMAAQALPNYQMFCQLAPNECRQMQSMFLEMAPMLEEEIYTLARQLGN